MDWQQAGFTDGSEGWGLVRWDRYVKACEGSGVVPDEVAWRQGYREGLKTFCNPSGAFAAGRRDIGVISSCTESEDPDIIGILGRSSEAGLDVEEIFLGARRCTRAQRSADDSAAAANASTSSFESTNQYLSESIEDGREQLRRLDAEKDADEVAELRSRIERDSEVLDDARAEALGDAFVAFLAARRARRACATADELKQQIERVDREAFPRLFADPT
ncbi:MAG: DUF2799 domain-containing protein [Parvularculaceae bacterium]|nr:DUF2799 domain-containing protein [Parvularculaceae bacterium]